jgi:hypothetical protein
MTHGQGSGWLFPVVATILCVVRTPTRQSEQRLEHQPLVDVHVSYERGSHPNYGKLSRALEVVTRNHVYVLDSALRCVEVRKIPRGELLTQSQYIGARLVGGYLNSDDALEMSYPFPRPGAMAVFETMRGRSRVYHRSTAVTRVELYLSIVTVTTRDGVPSWQDIVRARSDEDV